MSAPEKTMTDTKASAATSAPAAEKSTSTRPESREVDPEADLFFAKSLYPDAHAVFTTPVAPLETLKREAIVVLDTNTLLVPFGVSKQSLEQLRTTYATLVERSRLVIPGHSAREFAKNRTNKLTELYQFLARRKGTVQIPQRAYPLLEGSKDYQDVLEVEKKVNALTREYNDAVDRALQVIASWRWNDPVSAMYSSIFTKATVHDPPIDPEMLAKDWEQRVYKKIPPGYKDGGKDRNAGGDLIIWHTILDVARTRQQDVLFVTGETKSDWWHKTEQKFLYPRYELVDEYRRASGGHSFHMLELSQLMDLFGATKQVVAEIQREEAAPPVQPQLRRPQDSTRGDSQVQATLVEHAIHEWLVTRYPLGVARAEDSRSFDFRVADSSGSIWVILKYVGDSSAHLHRRIRDALFHTVNGLMAHTGGRSLLVIAASNFYVARKTLRTLGLLGEQATFPGLTVIVGALSADGRYFSEVTS